MTRRRRDRERRAYNRIRRAREGVGGSLYITKRWDEAAHSDRREWCSLVKRPSIERRTRAEDKAWADAAWANALANGWVTEDGANFGLESEPTHP